MPRTIKNPAHIYADQVFGSEDDLLKKIRKVAEESKMIHMQLSPHEAQLLYFLARSIQAEKIIEIGTLYSYSTLYLARSVLDKKGLVWTCDISEERHQMAQQLIKNHPEYERIQWVTGPALDTLPQIEKEGPFDLVFIDADKGNYGNYLKWAEKNLKPGGLLAADNSFLFGSVYGKSERTIQQKQVEIMKNFNQYLAQSPSWISAIIPTKEGLTVAIKKS